MNDTEQNDNICGDTKFDVLLVEFFQQEVPSGRLDAHDIGQSIAAPRLVAVGEVKRRQGGRGAGLLGLSAVGGSLLAAMLMLSLPSSPPRDDSQPLTPIAESINSRSLAEEMLDVEIRPAAGRAAAEVEIAVTEDEGEVEQYDTIDGPVEQRSKLRIRNVMILDPETGERVELSLPELEIEIFPIDDE